MGHVLFQVTAVWGNDRAIVVTHARRFQLGIFDPQANRIPPNNLGVELFFFNAGGLETITGEDDEHDRFIHGIINGHPGSPCGVWTPPLGFQTSSRILPVRAFSTVSSKDGPKSTPISWARFLAHRPTLRE